MDEGPHSPTELGTFLLIHWLPHWCAHAPTSPLPAIDLFLQLLEVLGQMHAPLSEGHLLLLQITGIVTVRAGSDLS